MPHASSFTAPPPLKAGSRVAVVSPSGRIDAAEFEASLAILQARYDVRVRPDIAAGKGYLAGDDARRAIELCDALADPSIEAVLCARGGFGVTRIVDRVDTDALRRRPKWIVGYSDTTALLAKAAQAGVQAIHAPHVQRLQALDEAARRRWFDALERPDWSATFDGLTTLCPGVTTGPLLGGNLSLLCAMLGTGDFPPLDGAVLLLEDVNEKPYRVDRMLTQLGRAGVLERVSGVAVGRFSRSTPDDDGVTVEDVLTERLTGLARPVVAGLPIGHDGPNVPVRLGAVVRIGDGRLQYVTSAGD